MADRRAVLNGTRVRSPGRSAVKDGRPELPMLSAGIYATTERAATVGLTERRASGNPRWPRSSSGWSVPVDTASRCSPYRSWLRTAGRCSETGVRMQEHATDPDVFIRSMATRGHLGGWRWAARKRSASSMRRATRWSSWRPWGVGQAEVDVAAATDTAVVTLAPGLGDAVDRRRRGEFCRSPTPPASVNKGDRDGVGEVARDLRQMLQLREARGPPRRPPPRAPERVSRSLGNES